MFLSKYSIRSLAAAALLALTALVSGCGGGGAQDPFASTPVPILVVNPALLNVYSGTPAVVTVSSGTGPFQVFTSDAVVLPVTQVVAGAAITVTANNVTIDTPVTLTVRDAVGQSTNVLVTVKPSPLIGALNIVPTSNTTCAGKTDAVANNAAICSGESGVASVTLRSSASAGLANRQVRFDVVQGAYSFLVDQAGTVAAKSVTVLTDQNGKADAVIRTDAGAASQVGLLRATDVATGNRVDSAFTIVQSLNGAAVLSVVPPLWTLTGYYDKECPGGSEDYVIYGGAAPYTVVSNAPAYFTLSAGASSSTTSVVVPQSGGRFTVYTNYSPTCIGYQGTFTITDASGRNIPSNMVVVPGSVARAATVLSPSSVTIKAVGAAPGVCGGTVNFVAASGVGITAWSLSVGPSKATISSSGSGATVTIISMSGGDIFTLSVVDTAGKINSATINCTASA